MKTDKGARHFYKERNKNLKVWKSKQSFFDDKHIGKIIRKLKEFSPQIEFTYWSVNNSQTGDLPVYGIATVEPVSANSAVRWDAFLSGYWEALND